MTHTLTVFWWRWFTIDVPPSSLNLVLLWQLFYLFCSSIVINTVIVTVGTFSRKLIWVEWTSSYYVTIPNRILIKHDLIDDNIIKKHKYNSPPTMFIVLSIEYAQCFTTNCVLNVSASKFVLLKRITNNYVVIYEIVFN
jgi:hypothetical protein